MDSQSGDGGRRQLQILAATLAAIPFVSGLAGMIAGPATLPGDNSRFESSADSEYRFASTFWFATARLNDYGGPASRARPHLGAWPGVTHAGDTQTIMGLAACGFGVGLGPQDTRTAARPDTWKVDIRPRVALPTTDAVGMYRDVIASTNW